MPTYKLNEIVGGTESARLLGCRSRYLHGRAGSALRHAAAVDAQAHGVVRVARDLTRMECRVKPLREGNADLVKNFDDYFEGAVAEIVALSREVIDRATEIRAQYRFNTPDTIHLAAAVASGCDVFLTNYHRLDRFTDITIEVVQGRRAE